MISIPYVTISNITQTSASWTIHDLSYDWNATNYQQAYIRVNNNQSSSPVYPPPSGTSRSVSGTISGLTMGTYYSVVAYARRLDVNWEAGTTSFTTSMPTMGTVTISSRFQGGLVLEWSSLSGAASYHPEYRTGGGSWISAGITSATSITLNVATYGVMYDFRIRASLSAGGYSNFSSTTSGTSEPKIPTISGVVTNGNTFTIYVGGMQGNWGSVIVERLTTAGSLIDSRSITPIGNQYAQWLSVPAGTTNRFKARSNYNTLNSPYSNEVTLQNIRPTDFAWTTDKIKNQPFNLTATEWNMLTSKINAFRLYRGKTNYGFIQAHTGNTFTALMFNQAVNALNGIDNPAPTISPPPTTSPGNNITASDINKLKDSLNSVT